MIKQLKFFLVLIGLLVLVSGRIQAAEITVDAGGVCTLAEAIKWSVSLCQEGEAITVRFSSFFLKGGVNYGNSPEVRYS